MSHPTSTDPTPGRGDTSDIERRALALDERRVSALLAGDADALETLVGPGVRYVHATGLLEDKDAYLASVRQGDLVYRAMRLDDRTVVAHGSMAVVGFTMTSEVTYLGKELSLHARCTVVWDVEREQFVAFQATPLA